MTTSQTERTHLIPDTARMRVRARPPRVAVRARHAIIRLRWISGSRTNSMLLRSTVREFAEARDSPARARVGRGAALSGRARAEAGRARADGHPVSARSTAVPACRPSTTASASRSSRASIPSVSLSVAAHNGLCTAHLFMFGTRGAEAALRRAARAGRVDWRVGADRAERRQRRGRHTHDRRARWRQLGV